MDFFFSEEQKDLRKMLRDFVDKEIAPRAAHYDETGEFPWENVKKIASLGLFGVKMPVEYGGMGEGMVTACIIIEELGRGCASTAGTFLIHTGAASDSINMFGSEEQKRKYLPVLAKGERIAAFALSEPDAGSDPGGMRTTAQRDGDYYILNGSKCWTTNGIEAEVYVVGAKTRPELREKGISSFILEKGTPGFTFGKKERKMGMNASATGTEYFDNCRVPKENLLGKENGGYRQALIALNKERVGNASICLGIARAAFDHAVAYAKSRKAFGETIASFQGIRFMIAEMATQLRAARWLVYSAAKRIDMNLPSVGEVSMAKFFTNEMAMRVTNDALQIHGAYGYTKEYPLERYMRDARGLSIGGGTTQIQRAIIASQFLD